MLKHRVFFWSTLASVIIVFAITEARAAEPVEWTGWYAGAYGSYISGELNSDDPEHKESTGDYEDDGPMLGVMGGYNKQFENYWLVGAELLIPYYMKKGSAVDKKWFPDSVTYEAVYRYGIFIGLKGGKVFGKFLPYGFGAVGIVNVDGRSIGVDENENYSEGYVQSAAATHMVWQIGAGADYQVSEKFFVGTRLAAFIAAKADHTMPWNEPGPNNFGYDAFMIHLHGAYRF
ncbi:MAG: outer membrane beta-barrel protein [candidate division Zixibacteria bacterium]|nr:outer membrane beta-barrel protein [candidate division Zixibacteria bacterium]